MFRDWSYSSGQLVHVMTTQIGSDDWRWFGGHQRVSYFGHLWFYAWSVLGLRGPTAWEDFGSVVWDGFVQYFSGLVQAVQNVVRPFFFQIVLLKWCFVKKKQHWLHVSLGKPSTYRLAVRVLGRIICQNCQTQLVAWALNPPNMWKPLASKPCYWAYPNSFEVDSASVVLPTRVRVDDTSRYSSATVAVSSRIHGFSPFEHHTHVFTLHFNSWTTLVFFVLRLQ